MPFVQVADFRLDSESGKQPPTPDSKEDFYGVAVAADPLPKVQAARQPLTPRINGASIVGNRPGTPFVFTIPATGQSPTTFAATGMPEGLTLDAKTGIITGSVGKAVSIRSI